MHLKWNGRVLNESSGSGEGHVVGSCGYST